MVWALMSLIALLGCLPTFLFFRWFLNRGKSGFGVWQSVLTWGIAGSMVFFGLAQPIGLSPAFLILMLTATTMPGIVIGLVYSRFDNDKYYPESRMETGDA